MGGEPGHVREMTGRVLARNTVLNLAGLLTPLAIGVVTIPAIVEGLGKERFGILALAWAITVYFGILDLGLGRAATKFVAGAIARGERAEIGRVVWTAAAIQSLLGLVGCLILAASSTALSEVLDISEGLTDDAGAVFLRLSLAVPFMAVSSSFRGALEAGQRFGLVNAVRVPVSAGNFLIPLLGVVAGWDLPQIVLLLALSQALATAAYLALSARAFPAMKRISFDRSILRRLFAFGGWVTVTVLLAPLLLYLDRFVLGIVAPVASVAFYAAPFEMVTRLWLIPTSLHGTLFPAFSMAAEQEGSRATDILTTRAIKYLILVMGPLILVAIANSTDVLRLWLGPEFAERSSTPLRILALGVFVHALSGLLAALLQAVGRADVTAKLNLLEVPIHVVLVIVLVSAWGILGAALAWSIRILLDGILLFAVSHRLSVVPIGSFFAVKVPQLALLLTGAITVATLAVAVAGSPWTRAIVSLSSILVFLLIAWRRLMTDAERAQLLGFVRSG